MMNKKLQQGMYGFMAVLMLLNAFAPLKIFAEARDVSGLHLEKITPGSDSDSLDVTVTINELQEEAEVYASQPIIQQAAFDQAGHLTELPVKNNQVITVPKDITRSGVIHLTLGETKNLTSIDLNYENQKISYPLESAEEHSEEPMTSPSEEKQVPETGSSEAISETTTSETSGTPSSSTDETQTSDTPSSTDTTKPAKKAVVKDNTNGPTDIRSYFPDGAGTIITHSKLTFLDEKGNVIEPPVKADTTVRIAYNWQIPEAVRQKIQAGDYFDFHLPEELKPNRATSGELKNDDGDVYATYTLDTEGNIRFTFTEEVQNQSDIEGRFRFDTTIKKEHIDGPGDITIHYPVKDDLPPVKVEIRPNTETSIDKQGHFDRTPNPKQVEWTVDVNQAMNVLEDATITEKWPTGITFQSAKVMELIMNLDGTVKETGRELSPSEYTVDANGNIVIPGKTSSAYRILYQTTIEDFAKPENGGKISFTNTAKLTDKKNDDGVDAKATVTTNVGKPLEKNRTGYDAAKQEFSWGIKYNYNEKKIAKDNAVLTDTISKNMTLVDRSVTVFPIAFNEQGAEVKGTPYIEGTDYVLEPDASGHGFVLRFLKDVERALRVEYKTKVDGIVTDPTQVTNSVADGTGQKGGDKGTAQQQNVIKRISDINYNTKEVGWKIAINKNHYEMNELFLKDRYSPTPGLMMASDGGTYKFNIRDVTKNVVLTPGKDYDLTIVKDNEGNELGFNVQFKNDYKQTSSEFDLAYYTHFEVNQLDPNDPAKDRFKNNMAAEWTSEFGKKHTSNDNQDFRPVVPYQLNAQKSGKYNAQNKHITWTIAVNHSRNPLVNAELTDTIKDNQTYVKGSVKVYEASVQKNGTVVKKQPEILVTGDMKKVAEPDSRNNQTLTIAFPEGAEQLYLIEFETSLEGKIIEDSKQYINTAQYENNNRKREVVGEVGITNGGKYVQKAGTQNKQNPDYVDWQAIINPSQSTLKNVVITDRPTENQVIDHSSIRLYETSVAVNGTITPNYEKPLMLDTDYTVSLDTNNETGKQTLTINMLKDIHTAYQLVYSSYITSSASGSKDTVSNKISVTGDNDKVIVGGEGKDVTVEIHHSEGSAKGKKGKLMIQKTEAETQKKLSGAHFQLWNTTKTQLLRQGEVSNEGQLIFGNLPYGEYLLIETDAPEGFTISDELAAGRRITINDDTSSVNAQPMTIPNERNKVILQKTDEQGNPITFGGAIQKGARFKLERFNRLSPEGSLWEEVSLKQDRLDNNGVLEIDSLPLGLYRLTELEAPVGYLLNTDPVHFQVFRNGDHQLPKVQLTFKNYQGEAELIKNGKDGNPLAGATFDVLDSKGTKVNTQPLVSQADGKVVISGLAPGEYTFVETKAPAGYIRNTKPVPFSINAEEHNKPDRVTTQPNGSPLQLVNEQGEAEFIKKNKAGETLSGATFDVLDEQGKKVNPQPITSDQKGKVRVDRLAPGNYTFVETKAPIGYLLNKKQQKFTIKEAAKGSVSAVELSDFVNYQGSFQLVKRNTAYEALAGAEFTLYNQQKQSLGKKAVSDNEGKVTFDHLAPGIYYFKETTAPKVSEGADYVVNPALIEVKISEAVEGEPQQIEVGDFQNFHGKAQITKVGDGGSIAGAQFKLTRIVDGNEQFVRTVVTPENGVLDISGLGAGSYKLKETQAAPGYIKNEQPIYFVVQDNDDKNPTIDNLDFKNYQAEGSGKKVDENGNALARAEFQIYKAEDSSRVPVKVINRDGKETETIVSGDDGKIYFKGLSEGHYVIVETKAPKGYIQDTTPHPFEVKEHQGKPEAIELGNLTNAQGAISVVKKDEQGQPLKDAEFEIRDQDGKIQTVLDADGNKTEKLVSSNDGTIQAFGLAPGKYKLIETKAPKNYLRNKKAMPFEIAASIEGKPEILQLESFINYQGSVQLKKVSESGQGLSDAVFDLYHEDGTKIEGYTTDKDGVLTIEGLAPGNYYFVEARAPKGYVLSKEKRAFTIAAAAKDKPKPTEAGEFVNQAITKPKEKETPKQPPKKIGKSVLVTNRKGTKTYSSASSYPQTNDSNSHWLFVLGVGIITGAGLIYFRRRK
ncbi:hypothetical protein IGI66_003500 [Enterococcus sp. AZ048]|uniref:SpaA isopeptide-forming pilin-related protein n=1 Tax=Enterococcus sp. AZ048 TaxID=2774658 RepID=UPI003F22EA4A